VLVDRRALGHHRIDIGHGDEDLDRAVGQGLAGGELIEVARVVVVDRTPGQRGQIEQACMRIAPRPVDRGQLAGHRRGELGLEPALGHRFSGNARKIDAAPG
jgi:hypothetical protein